MGFERPTSRRASAPDFCERDAVTPARSAVSGASAVMSDGRVRRCAGRRVRRGLIATIALAALVGLTGCTILPEREAVEREWFLLALADPPPANTAGITLGSVRVAPAYAGQGFVYRRGAHRVDRDFYNEWFLPPQEQIQSLLGERWHPRTTTGGGAPRLRADVMVTDLYAALERPGADEVVVGLRVLLRPLDAAGNVTEGAGRVVEVRERQALERRDAEAVTAALSAALEAALRRVEAQASGATD